MKILRVTRDNLGLFRRERVCLQLQFRFDWYDEMTDSRKSLTEEQYEVHLVTRAMLFYIPVSFVLEVNDN